MSFAAAMNPLVPIVGGLVMGLAGLALAVLVWRSSRKRFHAMQGPAFVRLCDGLGVSRLERWRLRRLAGQAGIASPAVLLISRGAFENALVRAAVPGDRRWVSQLRRRVFDASAVMTPAT